MELKIYKDHNELSAAAADIIFDCVKNKPEALLCFATGDSPKLAYQLFVEKAIEESLDLTGCFFIGLDEWVGISPDNTGSCHWYLNEYIFKPLNIDSSQFHLFNALAKNEEEECRKMNKLISTNGIDLAVVGVGMNGHIGFNEPGTDIHSLAHAAELDEITRTVGQKYFENEVTITKGITVGLKQLLEAETLLMLANGKKKGPVIKKVVEENISVNFPATLIRQHKNGFLIIDNEAASELTTEAK